MKKSTIFLISLILLIVFIQAIPNKTDKIILNSEIVNAISKQEKIRVFVDLENKELKNLPGELRHDFGNRVSLEVNEQELQELIENTNVKNLNLVGTKKLFLTESTPLINATATWNLQISELNLTGQGETVCVLDTGIDFTHPDLQGQNKTCQVDCMSGVNCVLNCSDSDVHGHGTHVGGTVAANGNLKGVAPDSKIISVRVFTSTTTTDDKIQAGIEWCIDNSETYNISIISMSLGGGEYSSYCDEEVLEAPYAVLINQAIAKNISVIVATGNDGFSSKISSPACIQNATAVGMTYDANVGGISWGNPLTCTDATTAIDKIVCASNRNNITDLFAPGALINSTIPGGYDEYGGTSMATPHVAGAFAIINQFKKLEGKTISPIQIQNALNATGKRIHDSVSGLNFSRIDVYAAVLYLDETPPQVNQISPIDNILTLKQNITFQCNATDELQLSNLTISVWNSTSLINSTTFIATENSLTSELNLTSLETGSYLWSCSASDSNGNYYTTSNQSLFINEIQITLNSPENNTHTNINETNFTCTSETITGFELTNVTFYLWNSTELVFNQTKNISGISNQTIFNFTFEQEKDYIWNCLTFNNNSNSSFAENNFTIVYDITHPELFIISPEDSYSTTGTITITFNYNVSDENLFNCSLIINNAIDQTNSSINSIQNSFTKSLSPATYSWRINCSDLAGNINSSNTRTITINTPVSPSGGGGSSSSPSVIIPETIQEKEIIIPKEEIQQGTTQTFSKQEKIKIQIKQQTHTIEIASIQQNRVNIVLRSDPMNISLFLNQTKKVNINNDAYYDLELLLKEISGEKITLLIKEIHEEIPTRTIFQETQEEIEIKKEKSLYNLVYYKILTKKAIIIYLIERFIL